MSEAKPKLSPLQKWINQWTKVPGAEDLDIEAAHRLGCFDGAMWLLEQAEKLCAKEFYTARDLLVELKKLCGKEEVGSE